MKTYDVAEIKSMEYESFIALVASLNSDEIIALSNQIGYPVFTRLCMGGY